MFIDIYPRIKFPDEFDHESYLLLYHLHPLYRGKFNSILSFT